MEATAGMVAGALHGAGATAAMRRLDPPLPTPLAAPDQTDKKDAELKEKTKHIQSLVQEFSHVPSELESRSILFLGGMNAVERWFSELGVHWVLLLNVADYASASVHEGATWRWITALDEIKLTIHLTESFFPDHGPGFVGMPDISEEEVESGKQATSLDPVQFALFFQETMSKMLVFVDVMFSKSLSKRGPPYISNSLIPCLHIYSALSNSALSMTLSGIIRLQLHSSHPAEVEKVEKEMVSLLSAKQAKAFEAIWSTLEGARNRVLKSIEEYLSSTQTPQGSSDIHEATCSVMNHINFLLCNHSQVTPLVSQAASLGKYVPQTGLGEAPPFISFIREMVSCLEEKLITKSQLFLDKGLGLLFLLNISNYIHVKGQKLHQYSLYYDGLTTIIVNSKVQQYIESYIHVSWAPMLSCLSNPTPLCLRRNHSPLSKFESEFHKTYTTQKLWKVPDPRLRKWLREDVIEIIIPAYTKYIEDNKVTDPKFTPQELEEMLQELFEGCSCKSCLKLFEG